MQERGVSIIVKCFGKQQGSFRGSYLALSRTELAAIRAYRSQRIFYFGKGIEYCFFIGKSNLQRYSLLGFDSLSAGVWYIAIDFQLFALMALLLWAGRARLVAPALVLIVATLTLRPAGLFGKKVVVRV